MIIILLKKWQNDSKKEILFCFFEPLYLIL